MNFSSQTGLPSAVSDFADLITIRTWSDAKFASDMERDPKAAVAAFLQEQVGELGHEAVTMTSELFFSDKVVLAPNPMGAAPTVWLDPPNSGGVKKNTTIYECGGPGTVPGVTADGNCNNTQTGGCPCTGTLLGTPCISCTI